MTDDDSPLGILRELIRIPSQNPMGRVHSGSQDSGPQDSGPQDSGPQWSERGMSEWLCGFFEKHNVTHEYHEIESGRGNVVARLEGHPDRPTILLDAHQDTVPVAGMAIDPFTPLERDGRLYGRGACDVKGSMAAMLSTVARLKMENETRRANVIVSLTCDEEFHQLGAKRLVKQFAESSSGLYQTPDMAIIAEPTNLDVVVAHKGVVRWKIRTGGIAVHSSQPLRGSNAIYSMARLVSALEEHAFQIASSDPPNSPCGNPTLSVGTIQGGQSVNIVPETCVIEIDRRIVPGESIEDVLQDTQQLLSDRTNVPFEMMPPHTICRPLDGGNNQSLAETLTEISRRITGSSAAIGVAFTTHAPQFAQAGIPTVVFGPGAIEQAHTKDEWIAVDQLDQSSEILHQFIQQA